MWGGEPACQLTPCLYLARSARGESKIPGNCRKGASNSHINSEIVMLLEYFNLELTVHQLVFTSFDLYFLSFYVFLSSHLCLAHSWFVSVL